MFEQIKNLRNYAHELRVGLTMGFLSVIIITAPWPKESDEIKSLRSQLEVYKLLTKYDAEISKRLESVKVLQTNADKLESDIQKLNITLESRNHDVANLKQQLEAKKLEIKEYNNQKKEVEKNMHSSLNF